MEKCREKIRDFLKENIRSLNISDDTNIFETGLVNSLFAMQLMLFLQSEFEITIDSDDLDINNFNTINSMVELVNRKKEK